MQTFQFQYPGDPVETCYVMNRREFLERFPREPIKVYSNSGYFEIPIPEDTIICDACNADPGDDITVVSNSRAYCRPCADRYVMKYCYCSDS